MAQHRRTDVRWQRLFDDLEAQMEAHDAAQFDAEVSERVRYEVGRLRLVDRLRPAVGHEIDVTCLGAGRLRGRLDRVGADCLLVEESPSRMTLVAASAIVSITGLGHLSSQPGSEGRVGSRLGLRHALRGVVRDRSTAQVLLIDGSVVAGTLDRVGADFVEVAEHPLDEPRRMAAVLRVRTIPLAAFAAARLS